MRKNVTPIGRTTPTKGKHLTFLDQMIGNMNKYGPSAGSRGEGGQGPSRAVAEAAGTRPERAAVLFIVLGCYPA